MEKVTPQELKHLSVNMEVSKKELMFNNFIGGLAWGFGSVVGATVVVTIIGYILKAIGVFAAIGDFFNQFLSPFTI